MMKVKIETMKKLLVNTAIKHNFNFQHPEVIRISQELDILIVASMTAVKGNPIRGKVV